MFAGTFAASLFCPCALIAAKGLSAWNLATAWGMLALVRHGFVPIPHIFHCSRSTLSKPIPLKRGVEREAERPVFMRRRKLEEFDYL
jgi:hypothetical protein